MTAAEMGYFKRRLKRLGKTVLNRVNVFNITCLVKVGQRSKISI